MASWGKSSVSTLTTIARPAMSDAVRATSGAAVLQGPHHAAQKSTNTGTRDFWMISSNWISSTSSGSSPCGRASLHLPQRPVSSRCSAGTRFFCPHTLQVRIKGMAKVFSLALLNCDGGRGPFRFGHNAVQVLTPDGFALLQLGGNSFQCSAAMRQNFFDPAIGPFDQLRDFLVDALCRALTEITFFPERHGRVEIMSHDWSTKYHVSQVLAHAVTHDHLARHFRGSLEIVVSARGNNAIINDVFCGSSAQHNRQTVFQLGLGEKKFLSRRQLQGRPECPYRAGNDGYAMDGVSVFYRESGECMPTFMIGHSLLLFGCHHS